MTNQHKITVYPSFPAGGNTLLVYLSDRTERRVRLESCSIEDGKLTPLAIALTNCCGKCVGNDGSCAAYRLMSSLPQQAE
jgi:hypothetical protein